MDPEHTPTEPKERRPSDSYLKYSSFALQLLGGIGLAGWAGYQLDLYFELKFPVFLMSFIILVFSGMLYQAFKKLNED